MAARRGREVAHPPGPGTERVVKLLDVPVAGEVDDVLVGGVRPARQRTGGARRGRRGRRDADGEVAVTPGGRARQVVELLDVSVGADVGDVLAGLVDPGGQRGPAGRRAA